MNIAVLGAGNVAWHLSKAFIKAGFPVQQVWNRSSGKATELALETGANSITDLSLLSEDIDLVLLALSDEAIPVVAAELKLKPHQLLVHTSGSVGLDAIRSYAVNTGVIYPLQTFSKNVAVDFTEIPVFIEGDSRKTVDQLKQIALHLSPNVFEVTSEQRIKLHISAVFACNFTNYLYAIASELLTSSGLDFEYIKPLIKETAHKALNGNPIDLQTGPAKRNDRQTIEKHLQMLRDNTEWQQLYRAISQNIVKMYSQNDERR